MISMMLMSGIRLSGDQIRQQIGRSIDLIVYSELFMDGVRRVTYVTDLRYDKDADTIALDNLYTFKQEAVDPVTGKISGDWVTARKRPSFADKFEKRNVHLPQEFA